MDSVPSARNLVASRVDGATFSRGSSGTRVRARGAGALWRAPPYGAVNPSCEASNGRLGGPGIIWTLQKASKGCSAGETIQRMAYSPPSIGHLIESVRWTTGKPSVGHFSECPFDGFHRHPDVSRQTESSCYVSSSDNSNDETTEGSAAETTIPSHSSPSSISTHTKHNTIKSRRTPANNNTNNQQKNRISKPCQTYYSANTPHAVCNGDRSIMSRVVLSSRTVNQILPHQLLLKPAVLHSVKPWKQHTSVIPLKVLTPVKALNPAV
ncbi:hypothetical protein PGTUg99_017511 [Puccinia graminis f. sp. tritici]|nr:hypothetical protein PGTUg99_017511 [Puccinia graminis f. sp. tritici]